MNERPTPETDRATDTAQSWVDARLGSVLVVHRDTSRVIERCCNAAEEKLATLEKSIADLSHPTIKEVLEQLAQARADDDRNNQLMVDLMRQRDEALEQLAQARCAWENGQLAFGIAPVPLSDAGVRITLQEIRDDKVNDALNQRDELLAALSKAVARQGFTNEELIEARAAIAAVKGEKP